MKSKWILALLPLVLLSSAVVVVNKRADKARKAYIQREFLRALDKGDAKMMIRLLSLGANPNVDGSYALSALDYAVLVDAKNLEEALIRAHVDVNRRDAYGVPPLATAMSVCNAYGCITRDEEAIFLLKHGAKAEISYNKGTPLLDSAAMVDFAPAENLRLIPVLLRYGADANKRNSEGKTAFDLVAHSFGPDAKQKKQWHHVLSLLKSAMQRHSTKS